MTLKDKLQNIAAASAKQIPAEARAIMKRSTQAVADSIPNRMIPGVGDPLPAFELPDTNGKRVNSVALAQQGPFVLTFFRGKW